MNLDSILRDLYRNESVNHWVGTFFPAGVTYTHTCMYMSSNAYFNTYTGGLFGPPGPTSWPTTDKKLAHPCMSPRPLPIAILHNIALIINALKDANNTTWKLSVPDPYIKTISTL